MVKLLIDADVLVYKAGLSCEKLLLAEEELTEEESAQGYIIENFTDKNGKHKRFKVGPAPFAFSLCKKIICKLLTKFNTTEYQLYLTSTDNSNFRFDIATIKGYKANRLGSKKPFHYYEIRDYLIKYWSAIVVTGMEADDAISIAAHSIGGLPCSIDKDFNTFSVVTYNWEKDRLLDGSKPFLELVRNKGKTCTLLGSGLLYFCAQLLLGDNADNIPGLDGYGPVKVYEVLKDSHSFEEGIKIVYTEYKKKLVQTHTELEVKQRLVEVAKLLWIKRKEGKEEIFPLEWLS